MVACVEFIKWYNIIYPNQLQYLLLLLSLYSKQTDMEIANTILAQLGGNKFIVMTGSKNFIASKESLTMTLTKNKVKAKYLSVTLNSNDTYTMLFFSLNRNFERVSKSEKTGVYFDQLQSIFTEVTGLDTHL